jgi:hypothetical protein
MLDARSRVARVDKLTNAMSVFLNAAMVNRWKVVVDDVHDIAHIDAAGGDTSRNEDRALSAAESAHRGFTLHLVPLAVHGSAGHALTEEEVVNLLNRASRVGEDNGPRRRQRLDQVDQRLPLQVRLNPDDVLLDVAVRTASATNPKANMSIREMGFGEIPSTLRERGGKEEVVDIAFLLLCSCVRPCHRANRKCKTYHRQT